MAIVVGDIFTGARALLNDADGQNYTNEAMMSFFNMANEKLQQECQLNEIPFTNKTSEPLLISAGMKDIGGPTGPALPNDLVEPIICWEISADTNNDYMKMRPMRFLPKTSTLTAYLEVWTWAEQYIHFLGANGNIQVKIDYIANNFGAAVDKNSLIKLTNAINYLKFATASLSAAFIGEDTERAQSLGALAQDAIDLLISIKVKQGQSINTRRQPFMASYKRRGSLYGR